MDYAGVMFVTWTIIICVAFSANVGEGRPRCPACARHGREITEVARSHLGWELDANRWLPSYATRRHLQCGVCGHSWWLQD
jgi:hypothetical protein